jgi:hypothetical protein
VGRPLKLACPQGHPFTPENTYVRASGARTCKACQKVRNDARAAELKAHRSNHRVVHSAVDRRANQDRI